MHVKERVQVSKPYLLAVGSHTDSVPSKEDLEEEKILVQQSCKAAGKIHLVDFVAIDCHYSESKELTILRSHMRDINNTLQST